jgi:serine/threonine-protein kinase
MRATEGGVIIGTAAYMSPEQASWKRVDRRADIWSFGVVLWEMLTGQRLFHSETTSDTLANVLRAEIDFGKLPAATPAAVRTLLRRCLDRDVKNRLRDIGEARIALQNPMREEAAAKTVPGSRSQWWFLSTAALAVIAAGLSFALWRAARPVERRLIRLNVDLGPDALAGFTTSVIVSPDGQRLIYPARGREGQQQLATRLLS